MSDVPHLALLQAVRLKGGMADAAMLSGLLGLPEDEVSGLLAQHADAGLVAERRGRYRLAPEGREPLKAALAAERAEVDPSRVEPLWAQFCECDADLKQILAEWQVKDGEPNDHTDAAYDDAIIARVAALHEHVGPLASQLGECAPRLCGYSARLDQALRRLQAGDLAFLSHPMKDSYHTVFHELHEELYDLTGKDRAREEAAHG